MKHFSSRIKLVLSMIFALTMTVSLAFAALITAHAEEAPADVSITVADSREGTGQFSKGSEMVYGEEQTTWIIPGWGGFASILNFDKSYDVQQIKDSGRGALTFYLSLDDENVVAAHRDLMGKWNVDISSDPNYSDQAKNTYGLTASFFEDARVGWQKIIIPLENPDENVNCDWSKISSIRFNTTGCGFSGGIKLKIANIAFTTTDYIVPMIVHPEDITFGVASIEGVGNDPVPTKEMTIDETGEKVTAYYPEGWGGYTSILHLDKVYNIEKNDKSALSVWVYFNSDADRSILSSYNIDVSSGESYSDWHKYSFQLHNVFEMCKQGWNHVILPLETANEKNGMDWSDVRNIRLNVGGSQAAFVATAKFQIIKSDYTDVTVIGYVPPKPDDEEFTNPRIECDETGLHIDGFESGWGDGAAINTAGYYKHGDGAWKLTGLGTTGFTKKLDSKFDLTEYKSISFWLYVDNAKQLAQMGDGQVELRSGGQSDDSEINWSFKDIAATLHDGWNYVSLNIDDGTKNGVDLSAIEFIRIYFIGIPGTPNPTVTTIFDDLHAHKDPAGTLIEGFDKGWGEMVEVKEGHLPNSFSTNFSGEGWSSGARRKFSEGRTVDIADYDMIGIWVYIGDEVTSTAVAGTELELSSSGTCDNQELAFFLPEGLEIGWNLVTFRISDGKETGGPADLTKINFFGVVKVGLPRVTIYLDDLFAFESRYYEEAIQPIEKSIIVSADEEGMIEGLVLDNDEYQQGTGAAMTAEKITSGSYTAKFAPVNSGLELNNDNGKELGAGLWVYVEDASAVTSLSVTIASGEEFTLRFGAKLAELANGWNWLTFKASEGVRGSGVIDLAAITSVTVDVASNAPINFGIDCICMMNINAEGALDPIVDRQDLEPIESVMISGCESEWTDSVLDDTNKKQGYSSVKISAEGESTLTATAAIEPGKTDLSIRVREGNELGVTLWINVAVTDAVTGMTLKLGSSDADYIAWNISGLNAGWNWVVLKASLGSVTGTVNTNALTSVSLTVSGTDFVVNVDRVSLVNYTVASAIAEPDDESINRNPITEKIFIDCDTVDINFFSGNTLDRADVRQGLASVMTSGAGYSLMAKNFDLGKTDLTKDTIVLAMWLWIEDVTLLDAEGVDGQVELTSSGGWDVDEISWSLANWKEGLKDGWNWLVLTGETASIMGTPDFDNFNYFRIYINNVSNSTLKLDRVTIGYIGNEALFTEPDWESELAGSGEYQGANGNGSLNPPYLDTDFSEPDEYTYTVTVEGKSGCKSDISAESGVFAAILAAAFALAYSVKRRRTAN